MTKLRPGYLHHFTSAAFEPTHLQSIELCNSTFAFARILHNRLLSLDPFQTRTYIPLSQVG